MALTQEQVVHEAVTLMAEQGLHAVTLRCLAARLGVAAPTLYWHVRDKRHLLDLMADHIIGGAVGPALLGPAEGQPWWDWLAARARAMRAALLAYPDGALVVAGNRPSVATLPTIDRQLGVLVGVGFTPRQALEAFLAVGAYVMGEALDVQAEEARPSAPPAACPARGADVDWDTLPNLAQAGLPSSDERFESGLALLIGGLRAQLANRTPAAAASPSGLDRA